MRHNTVESFRRQKFHRSLERYVQRQLKISDELAYEVVERMLQKARDYGVAQVDETKSQHLDPLLHQYTVKELKRLDPHLVLQDILRDQNEEEKMERLRVQETIVGSYYKDRSKAQQDVQLMLSRLQKRLEDVQNNRNSDQSSNSNDSDRGSSPSGDSGSNSSLVFRFKRRKRSQKANSILRNETNRNREIDQMANH